MADANVRLRPMNLRRNSTPTDSAESAPDLKKASICWPFAFRRQNSQRIAYQFGWGDGVSADHDASVDVASAG